MPLVKLTLPPGMRDVGTAHQAKGRWRDGNFVRWVEGVMRPIGKWVRVTSTPFTSRISKVRSMLDLSGRNWIMIGTNEGCFVREGASIIDVTPVDYVPGYNTTSIGGGYSAAEYGLDDYGTPRTAPTALTLEANSWAIDRWGEYFVSVAVSDGRAFVWKPGDLTGTPFDSALSVIPNAPIDNRSLIVTNERHLMLLGAGGNPRKIQWSDREDYTVWTPSATNLAGDIELETNGALQTAVKNGEEILVMSDTDVFVIRYVGAPFVYGREHVGEKSGVIGPHAAVSTNDFVAWMSIDGFYTYRGQIEPLPCDVWDFVFREMNYNQRALVTAAHNSEFSEVWWFFTSGSGSINNRYVAWNYRENVWAKGYLGRTAWQERGILQYPVAAGEDGHLYEHEHDLNDSGVQTRTRPYVESAPFEIGDGDRVMEVTQLIPDRDSASLDAIRFTFLARYTPRQEIYNYGPYYPNASGYTAVRFTGREVALKVESNQDVDWRLGVLRAEVKARGKR